MAAAGKENMDPLEALPSLAGKEYFLADSIGEGSYGSVRMCYDEDGNQWAAKGFAPTESDDEDSDSDEEESVGAQYEAGLLELGTIRELTVLRMLSKIHKDDAFGRFMHPGVMRMVDVGAVRGMEGLCMVMPKLACSLDSAVENKLLKGRTKLTLVHKLLDAVAFLHANEIIHRDIKTENVLLNDDLEPVLADYSLAKLFPGVASGVTHTPEIGTPTYRAPEVCAEEVYGLPSDVYSLGVVFVEVAQGMLATDRDKAALSIVQEVRGRLSADKPLPALLRRMLDPDPAQRPTCLEALRSEAFAKLAFPAAHQAKVVSRAAPFRRAPAGKKRAGKRDEFDKVYDLLECENLVTKDAARAYAAASYLPAVYCLVFAAKMYEEDLMSMGFVMRRVADFNPLVYKAAEIRILQAMDYCAYI